jgi:hypothetical protein
MLMDRRRKMNWMVASAVIVLAFMSSLSGCAVLQRGGEPNDPTSPSVGDLSEDAPLDSVPVLPPMEELEGLPDERILAEPDPGEAAMGDSTMVPPDAKSVEEPLPESVEAAPTPPPPDPEPPVPEEGTFRVELPEEERAALIQQASDDLATAAGIVRVWRGREGIEDETLERLRTIEDFMAEAYTALEGDDLQGAANLALKARLLAVEIGSP